jgi:hypothetical protein
VKLVRAKLGQALRRDIVVCIVENASVDSVRVVVFGDFLAGYACPAAKVARKHASQMGRDCSRKVGR